MHTYTYCLYCINSSLQIAALENNATVDNVNKEEEKGEGFTLDTQDSSNTTKTTPTDGKPTETKPTEAEPTDSPVKDKMVRNELLHAKLHIRMYTQFKIMTAYNNCILFRILDQKILQKQIIVCNWIRK